MSCLELSSATPFIDFHFGTSGNDYTSRIIETSAGVLNVMATLRINNKRIITCDNEATISFRNDGGFLMGKIDSTDLGCVPTIAEHRMKFVWNDGLQRMYVWMDDVQLGYLNIIP